LILLDDVKNVDSIGLITARSGIEIGYPGAASTFSSSGDIVLSRNLYVAGLSTFVGIATFSNDAFVVGTLTAGLIDGGSYWWQNLILDKNLLIIA